MFQQESILLSLAPCFQPGLRWMPDVSLSPRSNGREARCSRLSKVTDIWLPFFAWCLPGRCVELEAGVTTCLGFSSTPGSSLEAWRSLEFIWSRRQPQPIH